MAVMSVRFWGTRGSIPTPGKQTEKFGGNTTCVEIRYDDTILVIDAGSGIRELSLAWLEEFGQSPVHATLLFTHYHWDHLQGFPFFTSAYLPNNSFDIFGNTPEGIGLEDILSGQMQGAYFPVPLAAMQARMSFHPVASEFMIGPIRVKTCSLPHPGGCIGYRLEVENSIFVFATDSEFDQVALNAEEVKANPGAPANMPRNWWSFSKGHTFWRWIANTTMSSTRPKWAGATIPSRRWWIWPGRRIRRCWRSAIMIRKARMRM